MHQHYQPDEDVEVVPLGDNINYFYSYDMGLSAALITVGFHLVSLDRADRRKTHFVFKREQDMEREIEAYWSKELSVSALTYFDTLKMLKNRLYSTV
jgi:hypothetical protein